MKKRLLASFLAIALLMSGVPVQAKTVDADLMSEDNIAQADLMVEDSELVDTATEDIFTDVVTDTNEINTNASVEDSSDTSELLEEMEIQGVESSIPEEMIVVETVEDFDNEALFEEYVSDEFEIALYEANHYGTLETGKRTAYNQLNEKEKKIYDAILPSIVEIANGQRESAIISVSGDAMPSMQSKEVEGLYIYTWNGQGWDSQVDIGKLNAARSELMLECMDGIDTGKINEALMLDNSALFYWFGRSSSMQYMRTGYSLGDFLYCPDDYNVGDVICIDGSVEIKDFQARYTVDKQYVANYDPSVKYNYQADTTKTGAVTNAIQNARDIVAENSAKSDYEKLVAYKEKVCELVTYDHEAAEGSLEEIGNGPWELINVFDDNSSTNVVCEGYSKAFQFLCDISSFSNNIDVKLVDGYMVGNVDKGNEDGGPHMWNLVSWDNVNYLVDVTNCDNTEESFEKGHNGLFMKGYSSGNVIDGYVIHSEIEGYLPDDTYYAYNDSILGMYSANNYSQITLSSKDFDLDDVISLLGAEVTIDGETLSYESVASAIEAANRLSKEKKKAATVKVLSPNSTIQGDVVLAENVGFDINGKKLSINGNLTANEGFQINGGELCVDGVIHDYHGTITLDGGKLKANGLYLCDKEGKWAYSPIIMNNENDLVDIDGPLFINASNVRAHANKFSAGELRVSGDITVKGDGEVGFQASGTHKTVLTGNDSQHMQTISMPEISYFRELYLGQGHPGTIKAYGSIGIKVLMSDIDIYPASDEGAGTSSSPDGNSSSDLASNEDGDTDTDSSSNGDNYAEETPINLHFVNLNGHNLGVFSSATITRGIHVSGGNLYVEGDLTVKSYEYSGSGQDYMAIRLDGGSLDVTGTIWQQIGAMYVDTGDISCGGLKLCAENGNPSNSKIVMDDADGTLYVDGDFMMSNKGEANWWHNTLTAGELTINGDIHISGKEGFGIQAGTEHKTILGRKSADGNEGGTDSGKSNADGVNGLDMLGADGANYKDIPEAERTNYIDIPADNYFGQLELAANHPGFVMVKDAIGFRKLCSDLEIKSEYNPMSLKYVGLNGHNLTVYSDVIGYTGLDLQGGKLVIDGVLNQRTGDIYINHGSLYCKGLEICGENKAESHPQSNPRNSSLIRMENDDDFVYVDGDCYIYAYTDTYNKHYSTFYAGTLYVTGNFRQMAGGDATWKLATPNTHKVILAGGPEGKYIANTENTKDKLNIVYVTYPGCYEGNLLGKCNKLEEGTFTYGEGSPSVKAIYVSDSDYLNITIYVDGVNEFKDFELKVKTAKDVPYDAVKDYMTAEEWQNLQDNGFVYIDKNADVIKNYDPKTGVIKIATDYHLDENDYKIELSMVDEDDESTYYEYEWKHTKKAAPVLAYSSMSLGGDIGVNTFICIPERLLKDQNAFVKCDEDMVFVKDLTKVDDAKFGTLYKFTTNISAKDVRKEFRLSICDHNGNEYALKNYYDEWIPDNAYMISAAKYIKNYVSGMNNETSIMPDPSLAAMLNSMLYYGDYANEYFNGVPASVPADFNSKMNAVGLDDFNSYAMTMSGSIDGVEYYGSSLVLNSFTTMRHYFVVGGSAGNSVAGSASGSVDGSASGSVAGNAGSTSSNVNINDITFEYLGQTLTPKFAGGDIYYVDCAEVITKAPEMENILTISKKGTEETLNLDYNVLSYADAWARYVATDSNSANADRNDANSDSGNSIADGSGLSKADKAMLNLLKSFYIFKKATIEYISGR